jgi:hypothetical protein
MNKNVNFEEGIHSCGYDCQNPACIKAQRDELRSKYFRQFERPNPLYTHGWNAALDEAANRIGEIKGFGQATQDSFAVFIKGLKR